MKFLGISIKKLAKSNMRSRSGRKKERLTCNDYKNNNSKRDKKLNNKKEEFSKRST